MSAATPPAASPAPGDRVLLVAAGLAFAAFVATTALAVARPDLGVDAGYHVPCARRIAEGLVPVRDFPTGYSPGGYYALALLGSRRLLDPAWVVAACAAAVAATSAVIYRVLRGWAIARPAAALLAALYLLWSQMGPFDVGLETFVNPWLMLALALQQRSRGWKMDLAAGAALGAAIFTKQHALMFVPALAVHALWTASGPGRMRRVAAFAAGIAVPFLLFVTLTGAPLVASFQHFATAGGGAGSYGASGAWTILRESRRHPELLSFAVPTLAAAALVAWLRSREAMICLLALGGAWALLFVRAHPHYAQLGLPWAVLAMGLTGAALDRAAGSARLRNAMFALAAGVLVPAALLGTAVRVNTYMDARSMANRDDARRVAAKLPGREGVLLVDYARFHVWEDVRPPGLDYRFVGGLAPDPLDAATPTRLRDAARTVVVRSPGSGESAGDRWAVAGGLTLRDTLGVAGGTVRIYVR